MTHSEFERYTDGKTLYGNDFTGEDLASWYKDEEEGYSSLMCDNAIEHRYSYHNYNEIHGWSKIGILPVDAVALGIGSAIGLEFEHHRSRFSRIKNVESSDRFREINTDPGIQYIKARVSGDIEIPDESVDLVSCLGVLHHIPNVSHVLSEIARVMKTGGYAMVRDPITSMGDWSKPRPGLTKRERGIPLALFRQDILDTDLTIVSQNWTTFAPFMALCRRFRVGAYNSTALSRLDTLMARVFAFNYSHHSTSTWSKFKPTAVYLVLRK